MCFMVTLQFVMPTAVSTASTVSCAPINEPNSCYTARMSSWSSSIECPFPTYIC
ncbi:hypothetical protein PF005_g17447 [Phytophthora fragariae]|uniref:CBM1 domain-containing protein n=1 Tax=Phytophthora fragariae TaxID=53985 RepID=A0A6A3RD58_9STRA|nr:hypothetical protein PF003_g797 [Phytophthora fragariae]KAE8931302.1 hypothetical protein PF009_g18631 [Phytophthora fragariae]KAE8995316.1 hypothetical protein PF011_g16384 [Phytophthora fragariae]KAE9094609.1 hypothetical protein PF010_g17029 [Phytophthora fragariae]KAE9095037.1 hypothetical protein PF007_g17545 [Phytophthora fragariae]